MISFGNLKLAQIYCLANSKIFKFKFRSNSTSVFKVVKFENLKMTTQTLSFSKFSFMI